MSKQKPKTMLALALISFLSGCGTAPTIEDTAQCSPYFVYVTIENKEFIDVEKSSCFCRSYHFGEDYVGPQVGGVNWKEPLHSCNKIIGWAPTIYTKVASYWEELRAYLVKLRAGGKK